MGKRRLYRAARAAQGASPDVPPTWGERLAALRHVPPLVRLVFQTQRGYTIAILVLRAIRSLIPVAVLWIGKLIIDGVIAGIATVHADGIPDWWHLAGLVGLRSEEHTSELQSLAYLVCRLLLEKKKNNKHT